MDTRTFTLESRLEPKDYSNYLYLATFLINPRSLPSMALYGLLGAMAIGYFWGNFTPGFLFPLWLVLASVIIGVRSLRVYMVNRKREKKAEGRSSETVSWSFQEEYMTCITSEEEKNLSYEEVEQLVVSKEYFILNATEKRVILLRKKDCENSSELEAFLCKKMESSCRKIPFGL